VIPTERRPAQRFSISMLLGLATLVSVGLLILWDAVPGWFPPSSHEVLSAFPLALIALACLVHRLELRPTRAELARTGVLAAAFLCWSANQLWPEFSRALLLNDLAVALFVLDVVLAIVARPGRNPAEAPDL
jgi:hypothetical protein